MINLILGAVSNFILLVITKTGYAGIFLLMFLQSCNIPFPSEVTMSFSGFLVSTGILNFWFVVFAGALGNSAGGYLSYKLAGFLVGNGLREKYRILKILISDDNLGIAQRWFDRYGNVSVFFGRMIPVLSTFISFPAGLSKMKMPKFLIFTFSGSLIWSLVLTKIGSTLGENWSLLEIYFRKFDYLIVLAAVIIAIIWFRRHLNGKK